MGEQVDELVRRVYLGEQYRVKTPTASSGRACVCSKRVLERLSKLCNGPRSESLKQSVQLHLVDAAALVVQPSRAKWARFSITFPGGWQMATKVPLQCGGRKAGTEIDATFTAANRNRFLA